jgi:hypothetical protein
MARFWTIALLMIAACATPNVAHCLSLVRPEREKLYEIAHGLQQHVFSSFTTEPEKVRLDDFMRAGQLIGEQVHCSDFSLEFVTASKREWKYEIAYRPHLTGQPKAALAQVTVFPYSNVNEPLVEFSGSAGQAPFAKTSWSSDPAWDGRFSARQRDRNIISMAALIALPIGLIFGLIFAVWLARLRRHAKRQGAPSLGFMFALGSTLFVLVLGVCATPASSPIHWALVAFFLPSAAVVSTGIVNLIYDRAQARVLDALNAGEDKQPELPSCWRVGNRTVDDAASGYRLSWSTHRRNCQP